MTGQEDAERSISDSGFVLAPPDRLYLTSALYDTWDPEDPRSLELSLDFRTYLATLAQGQPTARSRGSATAGRSTTQPSASRWPSGF
jgi:hypothetical protein